MMYTVHTTTEGEGDVHYRAGPSLRAPINIFTGMYVDLRRRAWLIIMQMESKEVFDSRQSLRINRWYSELQCWLLVQVLWVKSRTGRSNRALGR